MVTHMGQAPRDHVVLTLNATFDLVRIGPDGVRDPNPFKVPLNNVLVVTDVDWQINPPMVGIPNFHTLRMSIVNLATNETNTVFESSATLNDLRQGGINVEMTSGIVVSSKAKIKVEPPSIATGYSVIIRGYLTRE
jgi:hypothetical protein